MLTVILVTFAEANDDGASSADDASARSLRQRGSSQPDIHAAFNARGSAVSFATERASEFSHSVARSARITGRSVRSVSSSALTHCVSRSSSWYV